MTAPHGRNERGHFNPRPRRPRIRQELDAAAVNQAEAGRVSHVERAQYRAALRRAVTVLCESADARAVDPHALRFAAQQVCEVMRAWQRDTDTPPTPRELDIFRLAEWADGREQR